ncbi:MAG: disulfide bond formation protein DsbA [Rhizobiales bacterium 65-79]|jgi:predicted DsbA family dithiol-disulfide isomerase|nr:DsbA family oxidoreductase [Hyphomicrobiales bacterium]OJU06587.1 MAG: disulfide bond formation protein DsbA [Rhizobiales bacterium 65-79]
MAAAKEIIIDVVSDAVCPWCFVGQKRLDKAVASLPDIDVGIRWRPFQLDPTIPPEGKDRKEYMRAKFGDGDRLRQVHANLEEIGRSEGIAFDFDAITVSPNTLDAHRLIRWAATSGEDVQGRVARRLFQLYFEEGKNIGDHEVLVGAARECDMDEAVVRTLLATDADRDAVRQEIDTVNRMGVSGVPCFLIEGRYAVMGAQGSDTLAEAIRKISEAKERGELEDAAD